MKQSLTFKRLVKKEKVVRSLKQWKEVFPFLIFGFIGVALFVVFPLMKGIYMSFYHYNIMFPAKSNFIGFDNYITMIHEAKFYLALRNTILYSIVTVPGQWVAGIFIALLINSKFVKQQVFFRTVYYVPVITSWVVVSFIFKYLFADGKYGFVNYVLYMKLHLLSHPISWVQNEWTAMIVIWTLGIWKGVGWVMIIYLAALQSIPRHYYEAAALDGANGFNLLKHVTLPLLKPTTLFIIINLIIGSFNVFIQVLLITNGGPLGKTEVLLSYMYKQAFTFFDFGYASAISVTLGLIIFIITWGQQRTIGKEKIEF